MQIISHRGYWLKPEEKNLPVAFSRSFDLGFGTETDVRDVAGQLVISHDMPHGGEITVEDLLAIMDGRNLPLAMNIKADGLADKLKAVFDENGHTNWFVFDMAVPDMRAYFNASANTFTRLSDVEPNAAWLNESAGIWLDSFSSEWYDNSLISDLLSNGKTVCVVSSELHGRDQRKLWSQLDEIKNENKLMLCTDMPEHALNFFEGLSL